MSVRRRVHKSPRDGVCGIAVTAAAAALLLVLQAEGEEDVVEGGPPEPRLDLGRRPLDQDASAPHEADLGEHAKVKSTDESTDMQKNMWARLRDSLPGACLIQAA